jgi:hypothetical protein
MPIVWEISAAGLGVRGVVIFWDFKDPAATNNKNAVENV